MMVIAGVIALMTVFSSYKWLSASSKARDLQRRVASLEGDLSRAQVTARACIRIHKRKLIIAMQAQSERDRQSYHHMEYQYRSSDRQASDCQRQLAYKDQEVINERTRVRVCPLTRHVDDVPSSSCWRETFVTSMPWELSAFSRIESNAEHNRVRCQDRGAGGQVSAALTREKSHPRFRVRLSCSPLLVNRVHRLKFEKEVNEALQKHMSNLEESHRNRETDWHALANKWKKYEEDAIAENHRLLEQIATLKNQSKPSAFSDPTLPYEEPQERLETKFDKFDPQARREEGRGGEGLQRLYRCRTALFCLRLTVCASLCAGE